MRHLHEAENCWTFSHHWNPSTSLSSTPCHSLSPSNHVKWTIALSCCHYECECSSASKATLSCCDAAFKQSETFIVQLYQTKPQYTDHWGWNLWFATCSQQKKAKAYVNHGCDLLMFTLTASFYWFTEWQLVNDMNRDQQHRVWTAFIWCQFCWQDQTAAFFFPCFRTSRF